jgi:hypothetical protein
MQAGLPISAVDLWVAVAGLIIAVVAAAATIIGVWHQFRSSRTERDRQGVRPAAAEPATAPAKPDLELKLSWMWPTYDNGTLGPDCIGLTLVNNLAHPVKWSSASIDLQDATPFGADQLRAPRYGLGPSALILTTVLLRWLQQSSFVIRALICPAR